MMDIDFVVRFFRLFSVFVAFDGVADKNASSFNTRACHLWISSAYFFGVFIARTFSHCVGHLLTKFMSSNISNVQVNWSVYALTLASANQTILDSGEICLICFCYYYFGYFSSIFLLLFSTLLHYVRINLSDHSYRYENTCDATAAIWSTIESIGSRSNWPTASRLRRDCFSAPSVRVCFLYFRPMKNWTTKT